MLSSKAAGPSTLIVIAAQMGIAAWAGPPRPIPFEQGGKWGYKSARGSVIIEPRYAMALEYLPEGMAAVVDEKGWAYIDRRGKLVIRPFVVDNGPDYFSEGLARFVVDGKFGFFDKHGRVTIQPRFTFAEPFSQGLAAVCDACHLVAEGEHRSFHGGRWGFVDRTGIVVVPSVYEDAENFRKGRAKVRIDGQWKYIDRRGAITGPAG